MPRIAVFPDGPLANTVRKGEVKAGYYNPADLFDRVMIVDPTAEDIPVERIRAMGGAAEVTFHPSGWKSRFSWRHALRLRRFLEAELDALMPALSAFRPDVVRGYSSQMQSWLAVHAAARLGIPSVVSLHADLDRDVRGLQLRDRRWLVLLKNSVLGLLVEPDVIGSADAVICAYRFLTAYATKKGARRIEVIYNRVDTDRFRPGPDRASAPFTVLVVSRLDPDKDPSNVLRAMAAVDGRLRIIGDGVLAGQLRREAAALGMTDRVELIPSVPHSRIDEEYRKADAYAAAYRVGGVSIPVLEAMASGLPVVAARTSWEPTPELVSEVGLIVDNDAASFAGALRRLKEDRVLRDRLGRMGRELVSRIDARAMAEREAALYRELIAAPRRHVTGSTRGPDRAP